MLSSSERQEAQSRWLDGIGRLETSVNSSLVKILGDVRSKAVRVADEIAKAARRQADPQFYIAQNAERVAAEITGIYSGVNRSEVAGVIGAAAESAYLLGVAEGGKRVAKVTKRAAKPVPQQEQDGNRRVAREQAEQSVDQWASTTAQNAGQAAARSLFVDVAVGAATMLPMMLSHDQYRSGLLSRNSLVGSGRGGMSSSFIANGMQAWIWMAGATACEVCWGKQGLVFPASVPFESHINCRCSAEPAASADAQGFDADALFARIPERQQLRVLGPGKHRLWKQKKISLRDIPDGNRARTLKQLTPARKGMGDIPIPIDDIKAPPRGMRLKGGSGAKYLREDGTFTASRQQLHDDILEEWLDGLTPVDNPEMMMLGGGPASGKTSVLKSGEFTTSKAFTGKKPNAVTINADDLKERLLAHIPKHIREGESWAAYTHEESSYLAKRIIAAAVERRLNVVVDAVGSNVKGTLTRIDTARAAGYRISGTYVSIPIEEALKRSAARAARSGRLVPDSVIANGHIGVSEAFRDVVKAFDDLVLVDNSQPQGQLPTIIARVRNGRLEIVDSRLYGEFIRKGEIYGRSQGG